MQCGTATANHANQSIGNTHGDPKMKNKIEDSPSINSASYIERLAGKAVAVPAAFVYVWKNIQNSRRYIGSHKCMPDRGQYV